MKSRFTALVARVRGMDPFHADMALAAAFVAFSVAESALAGTEGHSRTVTALVCVVALTPLVWVRRNPPLAIGLVMAGGVAGSAVNSDFFDLTAPFVAVLYMVYLTGRHAVGRLLWAQAAIIYAGVGIAEQLSVGSAFPAALFWTGLLFTPLLLAGRGIRSRVVLQREMREKAERHEAEREMGARRAVEDERARIAAELQAVVANGVSAMVVQADTVPRALAAGDSAGAGQALQFVEEAGRDALAEMRRLLGVLRRDDEGAALAPQPSLERADALVERVSGDGLVVQLEVEGEPVPLSSGVDLAAYRVLQEALAWVREAERATTAGVVISYDDRDVTVVVHDDRAGGRPPDSGSIHGLRERVSLYGGALRAAPGEAGSGFRVEARLPHGGRA